MENRDYSIERLKEIIEDSMTSDKDKIEAIKVICILEGYLEE